MQLRAIKTQKIGDSFLANCRDRKLSPKTLEGYTCHIKRLVELSPKFPPNSKAIQAFLATLPPYNADAHYRTWHALGKYAERKYRILNFMCDVARPRIPRQIMPTISEAELHRLATVLEKASPRDKAIMALFIDTAIRKGEACNLKRDDILEDRIIAQGKTGFREAPLSPITRDLLLALPEHKDGYVFHGTGRYKDTPLNATGFYKVVRGYLRTVGYKGKQASPQTLRRSFGRFHLKEGGDYRSLQLILGHSNPVTTLRYYAPMITEDVIQIHQKHTPGRVFEDVSLQRIRQWVVKQPSVH